MAVRRVMDMTEDELRELVAEVAADTFRKQQVQDQMAHLAPEYRTESLQHYIEAMLSSNLDYQQQNDPTIGMFDFGPDYATQVEEIMEKEYGTRKDDMA